jgi:asparagine synthase (glutamine-hydrolysing)
VKAFLAVSVAPGSAHPAGYIPVGRALAMLAGTGSATAHQVEDGWVAFTAADDDDRVGDPGHGFTLRLTRSARGRAGDVGTAALARMLGDGTSIDRAALAGLLPPFAVAHRADPRAPVVLAGDWLGLRQLFWWRGDGIAAVSTSARALAALAEGGLDTTALAVQGVIGWQVGTGTPFRGVSKLPPGRVALLHGGKLSLHRYAEQAMSLDGPVPPFAEIVEEMARILREFHTAYLADHPGTVLQLTGGQDSRLLLCAVPPPLRAGLPALTLDTHGGGEHRIAARLSEMCGLKHHVHWLDEQPPIEPRTAHHLAVQAAAALDCMASPLALASLAMAESVLEQGHRLSGLGGEIARGFYYLGQPRYATTSPRLVQRLAEWRLFANEVVAPDALEPDFAEPARAAALDAVSACFAGYPADWLRATDEFYLWQRMQRWASTHSTVAAVDRWFVNPMLDRRFLQLAHAAAPADKRDSHLTGQLILRLDPRLAAVPLDSGLVPARLGRRGVATTAAVAQVNARKVAGKVRQRLGRARRAQLGTADMAALVVAHWRATPDVVRPLRHNGLVRASWLDELLDGRRDAEPTTVAFLVNLLVATEAARVEATHRPAG